jgi:hypothetical protein
MGYCDYLRALLRPLGVYELDEGCSALEIQVIGRQLDALEAAAAGDGTGVLSGHGGGGWSGQLGGLFPYAPLRTPRRRPGDGGPPSSASTGAALPRQPWRTPSAAPAWRVCSGRGTRS